MGKGGYNGGGTTFRLGSDWFSYKDPKPAKKKKAKSSGRVGGRTTASPVATIPATRNIEYAQLQEDVRVKLAIGRSIKTCENNVAKSEAERRQIEKNYQAKLREIDRQLEANTAILDVLRSLDPDTEDGFVKAKTMLNDLGLKF